MNINVACPGIQQGTNIRDIKVPPKLRERYPVGIDWFDDALGGEGTVPTTVIMLTGMPGTGKSTLLRQLADSVTSKGHIAIMNSGEESLYQVKMSFERMELVNGFLTSQEYSVDDVLTFADLTIKLNPKKHLFLFQDSIVTLTDGKYADGGVTSKTPVRCCETFTDWAKRTYATVIFINQSTKGGDYAGKGTIKHMVDVHANIYFDDDKKSESFGERIFEITKNRFGCNGRSYILGMTKQGLAERGYISKPGFD